MKLWKLTSQSWISPPLPFEGLFPGVLGISHSLAQVLSRRWWARLEVRIPVLLSVIAAKVGSIIEYYLIELVFFRTDNSNNDTLLIRHDWLFWLNIVYFTNFEFHVFLQFENRMAGSPLIIYTLNTQIPTCFNWDVSISYVALNHPMLCWSTAWLTALPRSGTHVVIELFNHQRITKALTSNYPITNWWSNSHYNSRAAFCVVNRRTYFGVKCGVSPTCHIAYLEILDLTHTTKAPSFRVPRQPLVHLTQLQHLIVAELESW
jgi:hypothetical protein